MAKKTSAQPSAALVLLKTILGAMADAIAADPAVAAMAEEEFGLVLADHEEDEELDEVEEVEEDEEEDEEAPASKRGKAKPAPAKASAHAKAAAIDKAAAKQRSKKAPSADELAEAVSEGDLSVLDTVDDDLLLAVAKLLKAPRSMLKNADAAIGWLEENFGAEEEEDEGEEEFDVDSADEDELIEFAVANKIGTRSRLKKLDEDELRTTVADWLDEQGEEEDEGEEDGFDEDDFDDEEEFDEDI